mgnify:CR=1 FL=1
MLIGNCVERLVVGAEFDRRGLPIQTANANDSVSSMGFPGLHSSLRQTAVVSEKSLASSNCSFG